VGVAHRTAAIASRAQSTGAAGDAAAPIYYGSGIITHEGHAQVVGTTALVVSFTRIAQVPSGNRHALVVVQVADFVRSTVVIRVALHAYVLVWQAEFRKVAGRGTVGVLQALDAFSRIYVADHSLLIANAGVVGVALHAHARISGVIADHAQVLAMGVLGAAGVTGKGVQIAEALLPQAVFVVETFHALVQLEQAIHAPATVLIRGTALHALAVLAVHPVRAVPVVPAAFHTLEVFADEAQRAVRIRLAALHAYVILAGLTFRTIGVGLAAFHTLVEVQVAIGTWGALAAVIAAGDTFVVHADLTRAAVFVGFAPGHTLEVDATHAQGAVAVVHAVDADALLEVAHLSVGTVVVAHAGQQAEAFFGTDVVWRAVVAGQALHAGSRLSIGQVAYQHGRAVPIRPAALHTVSTLADESQLAVGIGHTIGRQVLANTVHAEAVGTVLVLQTHHALTDFEVAIRSFFTALFVGTAG
jgi:hypothetical protein